MSRVFGQVIWPRGGKLDVKQLRVARRYRGLAKNLRATWPR
jgi:hypothetical protein